MKRSEYLIAPKYTHGYIDSVEEDDVVDALKHSVKKLQSLPVEEWEQLHQTAYFPGKWTLNEVLQHIIDTERIMAYRALTFARQDLTELPGYHEDTYATLSYANHRSISELIEELVSVRISSYFLFKSFSPEVINTVGKANGCEFSVKSFGFVIVGHALHHFKVIEERYLPVIR